jgi:membrane protease YdiL (CAAX protease family)
MKLNDKDKVSIVTGICLFGLVVVLKNVLLIPADILSRDILVYIVIYWAFTVFSLPAKEEGKKFKFDKPLYWSLLIILITLAIIAVYAMK